MTMMKKLLPFLSAPLRPEEPQYLIFFVTDVCNARCAMCFNPPPEQSSRDKELTLDEIEKTAKSMRRLIQLTISGGEPFLREDLPEIIKVFARYSGVKFVTLSTNGFSPARILDKTERILIENPEVHFNFCLSIDDIGERHDKIRGVGGGFERLMETYKGALKLKEKFGNVELHTTTVLSALNAARIKEIIEWLDENIKAEVPEILLVRGNVRDPTSAQVSIEAYEDAAEKVNQRLREQAQALGLKGKLVASLTAEMSRTLVKSEREKRMIVPCLAGRKLVILRADGKVEPCEILETLYADGEKPWGFDDFSFGNVRDNNYDMSRVVRSKKAMRVKEFIDKSECHCTFECAIFASLIFGTKNWFKVTKRFISDWYKLS